MILEKLRCPDCGGKGVDTKRGGLCRGCHGDGKRLLTAIEQEKRTVCSCHGTGGTGTCDGGCGF